MRMEREKESKVFSVRWTNYRDETKNTNHRLKNVTSLGLQVLLIWTGGGGSTSDSRSYGGKIFRVTLYLHLHTPTSNGEFTQSSNYSWSGVRLLVWRHRLSPRLRLFRAWYQRSQRALPIKRVMHILLKFYSIELNVYSNPLQSWNVFQS